MTTDSVVARSLDDHDTARVSSRQARRGFGHRVLAMLTTLSLAPLAARAHNNNHSAATTMSHDKPIADADAHHRHVLQQHASLTGGPKLVIGMLVYPGMFLQDLVGPLAVFEALMNREIHLIWKHREPLVSSDPNQPVLIPVTATTTFDTCPQHLDVLFVPGGVPGTQAVMQDQQVLDFLADRGSKARFVTSVCTGSLILGAAGLLKGYKATSYWATVDTLAVLGAIPTRERIVMDRNRITGGGVTAGLDFGLYLVGLLRSPDYAQATQLYLEYDPAPPYTAGSPDKAPAHVRTFLTQMFEGLVAELSSLASRAAQRWPVR